MKSIWFLLRTKTLFDYAFGVKTFSIILVLFLASLSISVRSQNFNRPVPHGVLYPYEFQQYDTANHGYYLTAPYNYYLNATNAGFIRPKATILDKDGYVVWFSLNPNFSYWNFQYHQDTNLFSAYYQQTPININNHIVFLDSTMQIQSTLPAYNNLVINPHEFQLLRNGNAVYFATKDSIMDLSAYTFGGEQGSATTHVTAFVIQEFNRSHQLVFQWNSLDHIFPTEAYIQYGYDAAGFDYAHGNSLSEDVDGNLLASFRHLNAVYKINLSTGAILWQLGGKSNQFTFTNDGGFSGQHDIKGHADGSISILDNANTTGHVSRAVIYTLDTVAHAATKTWEYIPNPSFYTSGMGNHQITPETNHLIAYGFSRRPDPSVEFVDNNGALISRILFQDSVISYRSFINKLPFKFPQPIITCSGGTNSVTLYAPSGFQTYLWSTGSLSNQITVTDTGTYQVWVNYGIGMLGSKPFFIHNINTACSSIYVDELPMKSPEGDYCIYDLLGRKIIEPVINHIYIYRYANGYANLQYFDGKK